MSKNNQTVHCTPAYYKIIYYVNIYPITFWSISGISCDDPALDVHMCSKANYYLRISLFPDFMSVPLTGLYFSIQNTKLTHVGIQ